MNYEGVGGSYDDTNDTGYGTDDQGRFLDENDNPDTQPISDRPNIDLYEAEYEEYGPEEITEEIESIKQDLSMDEAEKEARLDVLMSKRKISVPELTNLDSGSDNDNVPDLTDAPSGFSTETGEEEKTNEG